MHFNAWHAESTDKPECISMLSMLEIQTDMNAFQCLACLYHRQTEMHFNAKAY